MPWRTEPVAGGRARARPGPGLNGPWTATASWTVRGSGHVLALGDGCPLAGADGLRAQSAIGPGRGRQLHDPTDDREHDRLSNDRTGAGPRADNS